MPEAHAILSASSAGRWLRCPPSAQLAAQMPETTSDYAEAGRLAHAIGELKARKHFLSGMGPKKYTAALKKLKEDPHYEPAMDEATDLYLDALKEQALSFETAPFVALEVRVDYSDVAPEGFGTADCVMIGGDLLVVCDYKNGSGVPVEAEENPQMMLYACGTLRTFRAIYGDSIHRVRLVIIQPHAGGVKTWETTKDELERWARETVAPAAALAAEGKGDFCAGPWCDNYFCPVRANCRARAEHLLSLTELEGAGPEAPGFTGPTLTDEEIGDVLLRARDLAKWVKALEDYAFSVLLGGRPLPGWKLVAGRTSRDWTGGADTAFPALVAAGIPEAMLYERKPVTPAALEKAVGKDAYRTTVAPQVTVSPGKPALAPMSDKRAAYDPAAAAFKAVSPDG